jgi:tetratricopeptide (TPR) repeat protein
VSRKERPQNPHPLSRPLLERAIPLILLLATLLVYSQVRNFPFINYDDPAYVYANPHILSGLTLESLKWAFTAVVAANWMPVTLISHMLDCQLFGVDSGAQHLVSLFIHALSTLLLFFALRRATGAPWPSAFTAFVFALHPLHVESVAWIAERKDVLSAFFWFLALYFYVRYAERPNLRDYLLVAAFFTLGLMSKPMLVTFPFTLLLFDVWPLRRAARFPKLLLEKIPLFVLSAAAAVATYLVQGSAGAIHTPPFALRLANAVVSYAIYLGQLFWPSALAVLYPYPKSLPGGEIAIAAIVLAAITALALRFWKTCPYLAIGWFWYLGTLVPVIGLIQVGDQSRADRYTYVPMIGLAMMLAWAAADLLSKRPQMKSAIAGVAAIACLAMIALTWIQIGYWENSGSLFEHTLAVTAENVHAEVNLGSYLMSLPGRAPEATPHIETAIRLDPNLPEAHSDLGSLLVNTPGRLADAIAEFRTAVRLKPDYAVSHDNLANALAAAPDHLPEALAEFKTALRLDPEDPDTHSSYAAALFKIPGRWNDAVAEYQAALRIKPDSVKAQAGLQAAIAADPAKIAPFEARLRLNPNDAEAHNNLGVLLARTPGRGDDAIAHLEAAVRLKPKREYELNLASLLSSLGRDSEALVHFEAAQRLNPTPDVQQVIDRLRAAKPQTF